MDWNDNGLDRLRRYASPPCLEDRNTVPSEIEERDFGDRYHQDAMCLDLGCFGQFEMRLIVEMNPEYSGISLRASPLPHDAVNCDRSTLALTKNAYEALQAVMSEAITEDTRADTVLEHTYHGFWDTFFWRLATNGVGPVDGAAARETLFDPLGKIVAEFQGLIVRTEFAKPAKDETNPFDFGKLDFEAQIDFANAKQVRELGYDPDRLGPAISVEKKQTYKQVVRSFINERPTLITRILGFRRVAARGNRAFAAGNAVLCMFLGGKAAYGSSLHLDGRRIARFFVIYSGPSRHQLSRLVMTLHHCGELRFATIFDAPELARASDRIRLLDVQLTSMHQGSDPAEFTAVGRRIADIASMCRGGLANRIAQSKYYKKRLEKALQDLRVRRMVGWQSYDGFVRRNVARHLDGIVAVGKRLDALQARFLHLNETRQQEKLIHLQSAAEWFAVIATTYYLGAIVYEAFIALASLSWHDATIEEASHFLKTGAFVLSFAVIWPIRKLLQRAGRPNRNVGAIGSLPATED